MFHHAHAYIATKLYNDEVPLLQFGSILPDLAVTKIVAWDEGLHGKELDESFRQFISNKYPDYIMLANGVHAHNILDDFTHLDYKGKIGYAFQNNKELTEMVARFYELEGERATGKAHNFIESGADILLLKEMPQVQTKLRLAINQIDKEKIAQILSEFFRKDKAKLLEALNVYIDIFTKYNFSDQVEWVPFWQDLEKLMKLKNIGDGKRTQLINKGLEITKHTYSEFLDYTIRAGKSKI